MVEGGEGEIKGMTWRELGEYTKNQVKESEDTLADALLCKPLTPEATTEIMAKFREGEYQKKYEQVQDALKDIDDFFKNSSTDPSINKIQYEKDLREEYKGYHFEVTQGKEITKAALKKISVKRMETAVAKWKGELEKKELSDWEKHQRAQAGFVNVKDLVKELPVEIASQERSIPLVSKANISDSNKAIIIHKLNEMC